MAKAGVLTIDVNAGTAQFIVDMDRASGKLRDFGSAADGAGTHVTASMAKSGAAIRLLENPLAANTRAVERFITLLPGVSKFVESAFPIIGAVALVEALNRGIQTSEEMKKALSELKSASDAANSSFGSMVNTIDRVNVGAIGRQFGPAAEALAHARELGAQVRDDQTALLKLQSDLRSARSSTAADSPGKSIASSLSGGLLTDFNAVVDTKKRAIQDKIDALLADIAAKTKESDDALIAAGLKGAEQSGSLLAARLKNEESAGQRFADIAKQGSLAKIEADHEAQVARIAGLDSELARVVRSGEEEIQYAKAKADVITGYALAQRDRLAGTQVAGGVKGGGSEGFILAQAGAEGQGKSESERDLLAVRALGELAKAQDDYTSTVNKASEEVQAAREKSATAAVTENRKEAQSWDEVAREAANADKERRKALNESIGKRSADALQGNLEQYKVDEAVGKGQGEIEAARLKADYEQQGFHSLQQEITYRQQLAAIESEQYAAELTALASRLKDAGSIEDEIEKAKQLRDLQAQIASLSAKAQASNAASQGQTGALQQNPFQQLGKDWSSIGIKDVQKSAAKDMESGVDGVASSLARATMQGKHFGQAMEQAGKQMAASLLTTVLEAGLKRLLGSLLSLVPGWSAVATAQSAAAATAKAATSATDIGEATGNAAVAATGAAAAVAWIPVVGPALAVAAAGTMFGALSPYIGLAGFEAGGRPAPGTLHWVGEHGPELRMEDGPGTIIPHDASMDFVKRMGSRSGPSAAGYSSSTHHYGNHTFNIYESSDAKETARHVTVALRTLISGGSAFSNG